MALAISFQYSEHHNSTAPLPPPTNLRATIGTSPISITLTWEQPEGANAVDRYEINYRYTINECVNEEGSFPPVIVSVNDGTLRRFTLNNSASTPVEEDSEFRITLTAVNSEARSLPSQPAMIGTADAGTIRAVHNSLVMLHFFSPRISAVSRCQFCECYWY